MMVYIIAHKNCMDGLAAAAIVKKICDTVGLPCEVIFCNYGEENKLIMHKTYEISDTIYFVDFSIDREDILVLASQASRVVVLDHHKTAEEKLAGIEDEADGNLEVVFDMKKSGATITYDYFKPDYPRFFFEYIEDRDLWKFELDMSKEVNEALRLLVTPNNIASFWETIKDGHDGGTVYTLKNTGSILVQKTDAMVMSKITKVKSLTLQGQEFMAINVTENISELGNTICTTYHKPALMYFITEDDDVVLSMRSMDGLPDVSIAAKALGGGGHRNAAGAKITLEDLPLLLDSKL